MWSLNTTIFTKLLKLSTCSSGRGYARYGEFSNLDSDCYWNFLVERFSYCRPITCYRLINAGDFMFNVFEWPWWHWTHQFRQMCDHRWENKTQWHRDWKNRFPQEWQEVVHFADSGEVYCRCENAFRVRNRISKFIHKPRRNFISWTILQTYDLDCGWQSPHHRHAEIDFNI